MRAVNAAKFSKVMRGMASVPSRAASEIARELKVEIEKRMDASQDPYGRAWKPRRDGSRTVLKKSGRGRKSILLRPTSGAGIRITVAVLYMVFHQFGGASHLRGPGGSYRLRHKNKNFGRDKDQSSGRNHPPKRSFLPFDGMPPRWEKIIQKALTNAGIKVLRG